MSLKKIFGSSGSKLRKFRPVNFSTPGGSGDFTKVGRNQFDFDFNRSSGVDSALSGLQQGLSGRSEAFANLRGRVSGGFGDLTRARVQSIRDAGTRTVGNLRNRLRQRRVLGSSFGENQLASTEALFAQEEERARAEGVVGEIGMEAQLIGQEFAGAIEGAQALLSQFNFETSLAAGLQQSATQAVQNMAIARSQAKAASNAAAGDFFGAVLGSFLPVMGGGGGTEISGVSA